MMTYEKTLRGSRRMKSSIVTVCPIGKGARQVLRGVENNLTLHQAELGPN